MAHVMTSKVYVIKFTVVTSRGFFKLFIIELKYRLVCLVKLESEE